MMKLISALALFASSAAHKYHSDNYSDGYTEEDNHYIQPIARQHGTQMANCGGEFTDIDAVLYPSDQLEMGEEAYLYTKYTAPFEIDSGYVVTTISFNGVPYPEFNTSLCSNEESRISKLLRSPFKYIHYRNYEKMLSIDCPIQSGISSKNASFTVPNEEGTLKTKISWFSETGNLLLCIKILAEIIPANHLNEEM
jgi:hypothetical protein